MLALLGPIHKIVVFMYHIHPGVVEVQYLHSVNCLGPLHLFKSMAKTIGSALHVDPYYNLFCLNIIVSDFEG